MFRLPAPARFDGSPAVGLAVRCDQLPSAWTRGFHTPNGQLLALRTSRR